MVSITNFKEIRQDGKVITECLTVDKIISLGWNSEKIIALEWDVDGKRLTFKSKYGLLAVVVPNRRAIAVLKNNDDSGSNSSLIILSANGGEKFRFNNKVLIDGQKESGTFCWFETSRNDSHDFVGIVFRLDRDQSMVQVDIDSNTGESVGVYCIR